jgi:tetratricopeptide (TPR) repeat protein/DNA-binding CsgD family transcriptional regulator
MVSINFYFCLQLCKRLKIMALSFVFLCPVWAAAQQKTTAQRADSIRARLKTIETDTAKATFLYASMRNFYNFATSEADEMLAEKCVVWLDSLAQQTDNTAIRVEAALAQGSRASRKGNKQETLANSKQALRWALKTNDKKILARAYDQIADAYYGLDNWEKAARYYLLALRNFESAGNQIRVGYAYGSLANVFIRQNEFAKATGYAEKSVSLLHRVGNAEQLSVAYSQLAAATMGMGDAKKAIRHQQKAVGYFREIHDSYNEATALNNLAEYYGNDGRNDKAVELVQKAIALEKGFGSSKPHRLIPKYLNLGSLYIKTGRYAEAETVLKRGVALARETRSSLRQMEGYEFLAKLYVAQDRPDQAAELYPKVLSLKDSVFRDNKIREILNLNIQYETEKKEQEIANLQQQSRKQAVINWILAGFGLAALGAGVFFVRAFYLQKRLNQIERRLTEQEKVIARQKNRELETEKQLETEKNLRLQAEMETKQREVTAAMMFIQQKNELLKNLQQKLQNLAAVSENKDSIRQINSYIRQNMSFDNDWGKIKLHFEGVHPDFFQKLKASFPMLSDLELRQCAYIKMKFSSKEIANLLSIDSNSVKVSRHRMKKKMNLNAETDLVGFIDAV